MKNLLVATLLVSAGLAACNSAETQTETSYEVADVATIAFDITGMT